MLFGNNKEKKELDKAKQIAAKEAIKYISANMNIGIGTGSTVNFFIDEFAKKFKGKIDKVVSSSEKSSKKLKEYGFDVVDLNYIGELDIYIDGADECNDHKELIKGGGAALTREKICNAAATDFICIIDKSKIVRTLGKFPLPIEVIPMARSFVAREIIKMGGRPVYREGAITDNGNIILDVFNFEIYNPLKIERQINQLTGVVCNGIFANKPADKVIIASANGELEFL